MDSIKYARALTVGCALGAVPIPGSYIIAELAAFKICPLNGSTPKAHRLALSIQCSALAGKALAIAALITLIALGITGPYGFAIVGMGILGACIFALVLYLIFSIDLSSKNTQPEYQMI